MRITVVTLALCALIATAGAESRNPKAEDKRSTNSRVLEHFQKEHKRHMENIQQAQAMMDRAKEEALRIEGAMFVLKNMVDEEQTTAPETMPALPPETDTGQPRKQTAGPAS